MYINCIFLIKMSENKKNYKKKLKLHCIAEIRAYWVKPKPFEIDNPRHHYQIA